MTQRRVVFGQSARDDLNAIYNYVRLKSGSGLVAKAYIRRIRDRCLKIGNVPFSGVSREDLAAGVRLTVFERSVVILYRVEQDAVWITNIISGGRDYEALFGPRGTTPADEGG